MRTTAGWETGFCVVRGGSWASRERFDVRVDCDTPCCSMAGAMGISYFSLSLRTDAGDSVLDEFVCPKALV